MRRATNSRPSSRPAKKVTAEPATATASATTDPAAAPKISPQASEMGVRGTIAASSRQPVSTATTGAQPPRPATASVNDGSGSQAARPPTPRPSAPGWSGEGRAHEARIVRPDYCALVAFDLIELLPPPWRARMAPYLDPAVVADLGRFVGAGIRVAEVFPPLDDLYAAFRLCPPERTRVLILGQDPYHRVGQAHGLSFSVQAGVALPPSLRNVYKELRDDVGGGAGLGGPDRLGRAGRAPAQHGPDRAGRPARLTRQARVGARHRRRDPRAGRPADPGGLLLWGAHARQKAALVTAPQHVVIECGHPSPMSPQGVPRHATVQCLQRGAGRRWSRPDRVVPAGNRPSRIPVIEIGVLLHNVKETRRRAGGP